MKITSLFGIALLSLSPLLTAFAEDKPAAPPPKNVDVATAAKLIETGKAVVLDVRTPAEYAGGHIAGSKNIDFKAADFDGQLTKLDKTQPYVVHCAVGGRSSKAAQKMSALGFKSVVNMEGGLNAWQAAGKPVTK